MQSEIRNNDLEKFRNVLKDRSQRMYNFTMHDKEIVSYPLLKLLEISKEDVNKIKQSINIILWDSLTSYCKERHFEITKDFFDENKELIRKLPNITPNGLLLPKNENIWAYNIFHKVCAEVFSKYHFFSRIEKIQFPINIRIVDGNRDPSLEKRSRASTKIHTDIWASEPSAALMGFLSLFGETNDISVRFFEPRFIPQNMIKPLDDYDQAREISENVIPYDHHLDESGFFIVDPYLLHQTFLNSKGLRLSIDMRFTPKSVVASDFFDGEERKKYFFTRDEWCDIGKDKIFFTNEKFKNFSGVSPSTYGYAVNFEIIDRKEIKMQQLALEDIQNIFGTKNIINDIKEDTLPNVKIRYLENNQSEEIVNSIEERIKQADIRVSGADQLSVWEKGWGEILNNVKKIGVSEESLKPQYFNNQNIIRFNEKYIEIETLDGLFKIDCFLRKIIFKRYLTNVKKVVELGCGTGLNLYLISKIFPDYHLVGADWSPPSQEIIKTFSNFGINAEGKNFDLFNPTPLPIDEETALITVHALEQIGNQYHKLLEMLSHQQPKFILNIEPIYEHYNDSVFDDVAKRFHKKRKYLDGYYSELINLEKNNKIKIHENFKIKIGSKFHDAYSIVKWSFL